MSQRSAYRSVWLHGTKTTEKSPLHDLQDTESTSSALVSPGSNLIPTIWKSTITNSLREQREEKEARRFHFSVNCQPPAPSLIRFSIINLAFFCFIWWQKAGTTWTTMCESVQKSSEQSRGLCLRSKTHDWDRKQRSLAGQVPAAEGSVSLFSSPQCLSAVVHPTSCTLYPLATYLSCDNAHSTQLDSSASGALDGLCGGRNIWKSFFLFRLDMYVCCASRTSSRASCS